MAVDVFIPISFLQECFDYDPPTGIVRWRSRPREHFASATAHTTCNKRCAGYVAGHSDKDSYRVAEVIYEGRRCYLRLHRVAWALTTGAWPPNEIDHENHCRADNRFANLREATHFENGQNREARGTTYRHGRWRAQRSVAGKKLPIGTYDTEEQAHQAYLTSKSKHYTDL